MKSTINLENTKTKIKYPIIMMPKEGSSLNWIILALSETDVLHLTGEFKGSYSKDFQRLHEDFTPFNGTVTLSND